MQSRYYLFSGLITLIFLSFLIGSVDAGSLTATPNPFTLTNTIIQTSQNSIANTVISGGVGSYTGEWTFIGANSIGNNVMNTITVNNGGGTVVAVNPSGTLLYMTNYGVNTVSVINLATNIVINTINVGGNPYDIAFNPSGTLAYITNSGSSSINVINVASNIIVNTITFTGYNPRGITINPSGTLGYMATTQGVINVFNTITNTVVNTISLGSIGAFKVAFNPSGTNGYVTDYIANTLSTFNTATNTITNTIYLALIARNPTSLQGVTL
jgi:YVTN family beta-propeller protein